MGNCLVTKLKSVVDNENLEEFDVVKLKFNITEAYVSAISEIQVSDTTTIYSCDPTKKIYNYQKQPFDSLTHRSNIQFYLLDLGEYEIAIKSKYNISGKMYITAKSLSEQLDLSMFKYTTISDLVSRPSSNFEFKGDLSNLKGKDMTICTITGPIYGDFADTFGDQIHLISMKFGNSPNVYGDLVEFARKQYKAGRTSYSFDSSMIEYFGTTPNITFNGQHIINKAQNSFFWEENATDHTKIDVTYIAGLDLTPTTYTATVNKL